MSTNKHVDVVCLLAAVGAFLLMLVYLFSGALGIQASEKVMGYESRLFDTGSVHTLDIVMDDWDGFIEGCEDEEYQVCAVVIDGESYKNVAIRAKGNTSLSNVSAMGSQRYSFKIEFDHYDSSKTYHGLDKLSLNNIIQDTTCMKDYLTYRLMGEFGVNAPLCSYVYITVNGEDWGLYLAVEGVEDGFLERNYGSGHGELYKPDSMSFGGGKGAGRDFDMEDFMENQSEDETDTQTDTTERSFPDFQGGSPDLPDGEGGFGGGMGSGDVKLQYSDDDPDSYSNIFDSAKTDITKKDKTRLIEALQTLSGDDPEEAVDVDQVMRYFVVHNFVVNGDSYTGSMIHNYYLYEKDGKLAMIPWDYNLAFGTFQGNDASGAVNDPIDTPLSVAGSGDRPMMDWIVSNTEYTQLYHEYFAQFLEQTDCLNIIQETARLIAPYVEKDPTKFYTYEEFETGVSALEEFCTLRMQSIQGQLAGEVPRTSEGQQADSSSLIDTGDLNLSDMGTMNMGGGMGSPGGGDRQPGGQRPEWSSDDSQSGGTPPEMRNGENQSGNTPPDMPTGGPGQMNFDQSTGTTDQTDTTGQNRPQSGDWNGEAPGGDTTTGTNQTAIWVELGISLAVLVIGLLIAWKFKGKRSAMA